MNANLLKGTIVSEGLSIEQFLENLRDQGVLLSKTSFYRKIRGESDFYRKEILAIAKELKLSDEMLVNIFFT